MIDNVPPGPEITVFLSSPSDMGAEREVALEEIAALQNHTLHHGTAPPRVIRWPEDIGGGAGDYSQAVINKQTRRYDIFVGLVGSRLGTPTPRASSGTEEEFDRAVEQLYRGYPVQLLLFFSNLPRALSTIDPYQLTLVHYFREKAKRLGILFHTHDSLDAFRQRFRTSLSMAYQNTLAARAATERGVVARVAPGLQCVTDTYSLGGIRLAKKLAPQWADYRLLPQVAHFGASIALTGNIQTSSAYFRVGFKYFEHREAIFSTGSVQTPGQNILIHVGKNETTPIWFFTAYRSGLRLDADRPLPSLDATHPVKFLMAISPDGVVRLTLEDVTVFETFFQLDGVPVLAILAWGDEHDFECELTDVTLRVSRDI